jgi:hypothetical protein
MGALSEAASESASASRVSFSLPLPFVSWHNTFPLQRQTHIRCSFADSGYLLKAHDLSGDDFLFLALCLSRPAPP